MSPLRLKMDRLKVLKLPVITPVNAGLIVLDISKMKTIDRTWDSRPNSIGCLPPPGSVALDAHLHRCFGPGCSCKLRGARKVHCG